MKIKQSDIIADRLPEILSNIKTMKNENLTKLELELSKLLKKAIDALFDAGEDQISNSIYGDMEKAMQKKIDSSRNIL
jgi:hypothetical protein